jgi:hypothetical protein
MELKIKYVKELNWSLLRAGVPLVHEFQLTNSEPEIDLDIRIGLEPFIEKLHFSGRNLRNNTIHLPEFQVNWKEVWKIEGRFKYDLQVEINKLHTSFEIFVLSPREWRHSIGWMHDHYWLDENLEMTVGTAYVPPGGDAQLTHTTEHWANPALPLGFAALVQSELSNVRDIKDGIMSRLRKPNQPPSSITMYQPNMKPLLKALFEELQTRYPNLYHDIERQSLEKHTQSLRLPFDDVWSNDGKGKGATCVDLVVFGAAILEACGARPGLVIIGNGDGSAHALLSCWHRSDAPVSKPLLREEADFFGHISPERCDLLVLDLTELSNGLNFEEALTKGQQYLQLNSRRRFLYMVDIYETRYPVSSY